MLAAVAVGFLAAVVFCVFYYPWNLSVFPAWLMGASDNRESGSATIRNLGLVVGAPIAIWLAWRRSVVASKQAATAAQSLLNERYQKASEMLGSPVLTVRLGGVYAFQSLIEEEPGGYYVRCMQSLCAFARSPTDDPKLEQVSQVETPATELLARSIKGLQLKLRGDVQAVMDMMRQRGNDWIAMEKKVGFVLDLRGANLRTVNLRSANLSGADLRGADLSGAYLAGANLARVGLSGADLSGARVYGADLSGSYLGGTNVSGTLFCERSFDGGYGSPATGISEFTLAGAYADPDNPPLLGGVVLNEGRGFVLDWKDFENLGYKVLD